MRGGVVVLVFSKKKGELWQHKKNTNMVTNSNAASFGPSGLALGHHRHNTNVLSSAWGIIINLVRLS